MIYHDDNGASLQPNDTEREGALDFTRTAAVFVAVALIIALASCAGARAVLA